MRTPAPSAAPRRSRRRRRASRRPPSPRARLFDQLAAGGGAAQRIMIVISDAFPAETTRVSHAARTHASRRRQPAAPRAPPPPPPPPPPRTRTSGRGSSQPPPPPQTSAASPHKRVVNLDVVEPLLDQRRVAEGTRVLHAGVDHQGPRRPVCYLAQPAHLLEVATLARAREGRRRRPLRRLLVELALGVEGSERVACEGREVAAEGAVRRLGWNRLRQRLVLGPAVSAQPGGAGGIVGGGGA